MIKKIRIKKWSTHWSVRIWDNPSQEFPRVRSANIDKNGRSPHLSTILREEKDIANSVTFDDVEIVWQ
jgi:hypothetical protein